MGATVRAAEIQSESHQSLSPVLVSGLWSPFLVSWSPVSGLRSPVSGLWSLVSGLLVYDLCRAGKKYRLVDNIGARLGSEANFGSDKIKIASKEIKILGKIWINMKKTYKLIARNASGNTQKLFAQLIQHDGG